MEREVNSHLFPCIWSHGVVQRPWAIPATSLMGAWIQQAAMAGWQTGNWKSL